MENITITKEQADRIQFHLLTAIGRYRSGRGQSKVGGKMRQFFAREGNEALELYDILEEQIHRII